MNDMWQIRVEKEGRLHLDIRLKFTRGKEVMFISHLDLMRTFARAFRRGQIPVSYSKGFNPHANMVFGLPLSVGVTSECEYLDITLEDESYDIEPQGGELFSPDTSPVPDVVSEPENSFSPEDLIKRINAQLPDGIKILEASIRQDKANIMSQISFAAYTVTLAVGADDHTGESPLEILKTRIENFLNCETYPVEKTTKNKRRLVDIRPLVKKLEVETSGADPGSGSDSGYGADFDSGSGSNSTNLLTLKMLLCAGSKDNLKPELLLSSLRLDDADPFIKVSIHRTGLYIEQDGAKVIGANEDDGVAKWLEERLL